MIKVPVIVDGAANDSFYLTTLCTPVKNTYVGCTIKSIKEKATLEGTEITVTIIYKKRK